MNYDPHTGRQVKFLRTDPSGRWSPIQPQKDSLAVALFWTAVWCVLIAGMVVVRV